RKGLAVKPTQVAASLDQVAGLAGTQFPVFCSISSKQPIDGTGRDLGAGLGRISSEHVGPTSRCWLLKRKPVAHAPKECGVGDLLQRKVRRDDEHQPERYFELLSRVQREMIDALLKRDDPTVQQLVRLDALAAE